MEMEKNREVALRLTGVKKRYRLGQIGGGTLTADLQSWWARLRGKEDPNTMIGTDQRLVGKTFMALNGIDLTVYKGEALGIIGGNGAGKSTMLKLLCRVTAPTEGEIDLYGRIASMLEVGTGFNGEMTGRENIYMNGAILGMTRAEIDEKMEEIIDFSEVREFIDTPVKRYSSGMFVKLAFSVAAHLDSEIMIMDEVLAVGDMAFQKKCLSRMRAAAKQEGRTVLYVSHNMNTIRTLCDRCIVLDKGKIIFDGETEKAISIYLSSARELSVVNEYPGKHTGFEMDQKIHIDRGCFEGKELPVFERSEEIHIRVDYTSQCRLENVAARVTLFSSDKVAIGLATSKPKMTVCQGENTSHLTLKTDWLAPGMYLGRITFYSVNEYGMNQSHDVVDDAFSFEMISGLSDNNNMEWHNSWWGYMVFPEIEIR